METDTNPEELLEALNCLITEVGEAYVELSGQTAATQAVVADLRRCAAFLNTRLAGEQPPAPWLLPVRTGGSTSFSSTPTITPPPGRRSPISTVDSTAAPNSAMVTPLSGPPSSFRSPSPSRGPMLPTALGDTGGGGSPGMSTPIDGGARTQQGTPAAPGSCSRPPLASGGAGKGGAAGARTAGRVTAASGPGLSVRNLGAMPAAGRPSGAAARTRDASPQRLGPGVALASPGPPMRAASPGGVGTPRSQPTTPFAGGTPAAVPQDVSPAHPDVPSHLPLAAQRAMAAAASMAASNIDGGGGSSGAGGAAGSGMGRSSGASGGQADGGIAAVTKPVGPPQLPLALRRAMHQYRETLSTREQLVQQQAQRRGGGPGMNTLADSVSAASRSYCSSLARLYPAASSATSVGVSASLAVQLQRMSLDPSARELQLQQEVVAALRREVQVKFSALVAAQTWLTQSLADVQRSRGAGGGVAASNRRAAQADACAALLPEVAQLRAELAKVQGELRGAEERLSGLQSRQAQLQQQRGRAGPAGAGSSAAAEAANAALIALGIDDELAEAAALWRNRFLRSMLAEVAAVAAGAGAGGRPSGGHGVGARGRGGRQPLAAAAAGRGGGGQPADSTATMCSMPRPLGMWLPDAMWELATGAALVPASGPGPAWVALLPPHRFGSSAPPPPAVLCGSAQEAVAYGRAQQQLQATVFQLYLEGELAAPLLPRQRPTPPPLQPAGGHGAGQQRASVVELAWERWLAQCRLAHLLLVKGAWNKLCSVVELEEEQEEACRG
ncbi:hypothetical protein HYH02_005754 [Chlamydomonas schloesseri]|uniref:Uncharacterized protein n=1 Tax=Chlamydomonas schloesseri TaxID=2026947 RepID=A0A836B6J9_9CHLO|nr:hypothetical protein HYH02_005754 [Chlamydomonas schloesseri]|eukprot:KAG2449000.1 hypothetical protein HYH02_005754 [Chlamydomonas schloesseri]